MVDMSYMSCGTTAFVQPTESWDESSLVDMAGRVYCATAFDRPIELWHADAQVRPRFSPAPCGVRRHCRSAEGLDKQDRGVQELGWWCK